MADSSDRERALGAETDPEPADEGMVVRGGARRRRRVVALSVRDQERVARGEAPEDLAQADYEHDALSGAPEPGGAGSNDARLKLDIPPHWG